MNSNNNRVIRQRWRRHVSHSLSIASLRSPRSAKLKKEIGIEDRRWKVDLRIMDDGTEDRFSVIIL